MKFLIKNKYWEIAKEYDKEKLLYLLIDRPDEIDSYGDFIWKHGVFLWHRNYDLPAVVWSTGSIFWRENNKKHRKDSNPAVIWAGSMKEYWLNGKHML